MQHFGAPTRLLDWTDGALIGLYFAVKDSTGEHDAAVWVLDPYEPRLVKIIIPSFLTETVRQELDTCGIDDATIFPDLEGLSRTVAARWRPRRTIAPHSSVFTRLRPSKVAEGGVGVFAIRKIPKGTSIFPDDSDAMVWVEEESLSKLPKAIRKLYDDFSIIKGKKYACPPTFNRLTPAWYLNESKKPNVACNNQYDFFALRDIQAGEELTVDYSTYSDPAPA